MASTFFGLSIATSGLRTYQACANTVANNIANVDTTGYSKQVTNTSTTSSLRSYTSYGTLGTGVSADSVAQLRSEYYDTKYWLYSGYQSEYDTKLSYLDQMQTYFEDDSTIEGFSSVYSEFFTYLDSLKDSPSDTSVRNQVISGAINLCNYFNVMATSLMQVQQDLNTQVKTTVDTINAIAQKISLLNQQINQVEISGSYANELRDERALLIDELSTYVSVEVEETQVVNSNYPDMYTGATNYVVKINGVELVNGDEYRQLECVAREYKDNQNDADGLYDIVWADNQSSFSATGSNCTGSLKALLELRDGNNGENFTGTVTKASGRTVVVSNCSITTEEALNLPSEGVITLGNQEYTYSSWTMTTLASGEVEFTFTISSDTTGLSSTLGYQASVGDSIDYKGIPYYQAQMNEFLRAFAKAFNDIEEEGVDLYGNAMSAFFVAENSQGYELGFVDSGSSVVKSTSDSYFQLTAANITVASASIDDPSIFSTAVLEDFINGVDNQDLVEELLTLQSSVTLYRGSSGEKFLEMLINDVTVDTSDAELMSDNYTTIVNTVSNQRTSISGVDEDEEALDLVKYQNAYDLCAKVVQILSEMYDRLITETGV